MDVMDLTISSLRTHLNERISDAFARLGLADPPPLDLVRPPDPAMGDLGFPCFPLAKRLRKAPVKIAEELAALLEPDALVARASAEKGYVNLHLRPEALFRLALHEILARKERFGSDQTATPKQVMVEFSSPNTNKPLHLGHLRNNLLGNSLSRILGFFGHRVTRINLVNDRGVHICKSMLAYKRWGQGNTPTEAGRKGDHLVGDFYVLFERRFSEEYTSWKSSSEAESRVLAWLSTPAGQEAVKAHEKSSEAPAPAAVFFEGFRDAYFNTLSPLGAEVRAMLLAWEDGDPEVMELWRTMNGWVLDGFEATYRRMGVAFDHVQRESDTYKLGRRLVEEGLARGLFERLPTGAVVCDLGRVGLSGQKVLLRSDGTSVYMTQDLGTAAERFERFQLDRLIYVVGDEQIYHFDVLFRLLGLLRPGLERACHHLAYGMIRLPEGRMKSREGTVVDADDLMDEVHALAREETLSRSREGKAHTEGISDEDLENRAELIGLGAIKYFLLKFSPHKTFEYNPRESIDFLGQTGPYCLFNYARTRSLLRRAGGEPEFRASWCDRLGTPEELALLHLLMQFPEVVARAAEALDPSRLTEYLFDLCKGFAFIFTDKANHPIVTCEDPDLRGGRLMLVAAVSHTLRAGLELLGIEALEEM